MEKILRDADAATPTPTRSGTGFLARWGLLFGVTLGLVVLLGITGTVAYLAGMTGYAPLALAFAPIAVVLAVVVTIRHDWGALGFRRPAHRLSWWVIAVMAALPLSGVVLSSGVGVDVRALIGFAALAALVGFVEETLFRGVLLRAFASRGVSRSVAVTSVAFALAHTVTAISPDADGPAVIRTVVFALAFGVAAALLTLATRSILPAIVLHASFDFVGFVFTQRSAALTDTVSIAVCLLLVVTLIVTMGSAARRSSSSVETDLSVR